MLRITTKMKTVYIFFSITFHFLLFVEYGNGTEGTAWPTMVFTKGETAQLPCLPQGDANAYFWRKGKWFNVSENIASIVHGIPDTSEKYGVELDGTLNIRNITSSDEGRYYCRIASEVNECHGTITVYLRVTVDQLDISIKECNSKPKCILDFAPMSEIDLTCSANFVTDSMKLRWYDGLNEIVSEEILPRHSGEMISSKIRLTFVAPTYLTCEAVGIDLPRSVAHVQLTEGVERSTGTPENDMVLPILVGIFSLICLILGSLLIATYCRSKVDSDKIISDERPAEESQTLLKSTISNLQVEVDTLQSTISNLQGEVDTLQSTKANLQNQVDTHKSEYRKLQKMMPTRNDQNTDLEKKEDKEKADLQIQVETLKRENSELLQRSKGAASDTETSTTKTDLKNMESQFLQKKTVLQTNLNNAIKDLQTSSEQLTKVKTELQNTKKDLSEAKSDFQETKTELDKTKIDLQKTKRALHEKESDLQKMYEETTHRTAYAQEDSSQRRPRVIIRLNSSQLSVKEDTAIYNLLKSNSNVVYYSGPSSQRETLREINIIIQNFAYGGRYCIIAFGSDQENIKNTMYHKNSGIITRVVNYMKLLVKEIANRGFQVKCFVSVSKVQEQDSHCSFVGPKKSSQESETWKLLNSREIVMKKFSLLSESDILHIILETLGNLQSNKEHGVVRFTIETFLKSHLITMGGLMIASIHSRDKVHLFCGEKADNDFAALLKLYTHDPKGKCVVIANCSEQQHGEMPKMIEATKKVMTALTPKQSNPGKGTTFK